MRKLILLGFVLSVLSAGAYAQYGNQIIVEPLLKTDTTFIGQKIVYPDVDQAEVTMLKITLKPGVETGWHKHAIPLFAYVLQGTLSVEIDDGKSMEFPVNSAVSETFNTYHIGRNNTDEDVILIAFYLGGKDVPLAVPRN